MAKPLAVLIVEDMESDAQLIVRLLTKAGYTLTFEQVETAAQMRHSLEKQPWEMVISDFSMPELDGNAALKVLQETGLDIPFIAVSGTMGEETAVAMMKAGAHDYVMKGNLARLVPAVERELKQAEVRLERKQADEALRASEQQNRTIIQTAMDGFWLIDSQGRLLEVNETYSRMSGYSAQELLTMRISDLESGESVNETAAHIQKIMEQGEDRFESRHRRKDGSIFVVEISVQYRPEEDGRFVGFLRDITERKQTEEALLESETIFTSFMEHSPVFVFFKDKETRPIRLSSNFEQMLGIPVSEALGKTMYELFPSDIAKSMVVDDLRILSEGKRVNVIEELNGHTYETTKFPIFKDGKPDMLAGFTVDITESKQAEDIVKEYTIRLEADVAERTRELIDAQEKLIRQEKLAVLGQIAGGVSHELRNPLGVINNAVYYLKLVQPDADDKVRQYHAMIEQEVHNAQKIITDLLDFARGISADQEKVSVPELVQRVLERFPTPPSVEVALKLSADLPKVYADPRQMEQVLGNLVDNAYQAMPNGGKLTITTHRRKEMVAIAVKDTGMGIPPENMPKLFEPLFTTKITGIGLGLPISQKLAEANGARIQVESLPGKGSTFTLVLPVQEDIL